MRHRENLHATFLAPPCPATHIMAQGRPTATTHLTLTSGVNWLTPQHKSRASPGVLRAQPSPCCHSSLHLLHAAHSGGSKETPFPATTTQQGQFPPSPSAASPHQLTHLQLPYTSGIHPVLQQLLLGTPQGCSHSTNTTPRVMGSSCDLLHDPEQPV